jgi:hypothetical protein
MGCGIDHAEENDRGSVPKGQGAAAARRHFHASVSRPNGEENASLKS